MAAPLTTNPQAGAVQSPVNKTAPQTPQSPKSQAQEQERVTLLLQINQILLTEIMAMQEQGKGGDVQTPTAPKPNEEKKEPEKQASKEYVECVIISVTSRLITAELTISRNMRRMQANLAYLANVAERPNRPSNQVMHWPPIMVAPASPPNLVEMYTKLQTLFPRWKEQQSKLSASPLHTPQSATGPTNSTSGDSGA
jgi:hypothetical protein